MGPGMEGGRKRLWLAAVGSGAVLALLIGSVFLSRQGRLGAANVFALSAVTLVHVWSSIECMATLYVVWKVLRSWGPAQQKPSAPFGYGDLLWFVGVLIISLSSMSSWAALWEDDYRKFLAVSLRECGCWSMLTT